MSKRQPFNEVLQSKVRTEQFAKDILESGFQSVWKQVNGIPSDGSSNPTYNDYMKLLKAGIKLGVHETVELATLPFEKRSGELKFKGEDRWKAALNWCRIRDSIQASGSKPVANGMMKSLNENGFINADKLNLIRIHQEVGKTIGINETLKKLEGKPVTQTVNTHTRHQWRKELLPFWDGMDAITGEDLYLKFGDKQLASDQVDCCHKSGKAIHIGGEREATSEDVFFTQYHRTYDRLAKELEQPPHEEMVDIVRDLVSVTLVV